MDRRAFMKMLGIGGMGAVVAGDVTPLFVAGEAHAALPVQESLRLGAHFVVKCHNHTNQSAINQWTVCTNRIFKTDTVQQAHSEYYLAALGLRKMFVEQTLDRMANPSMFQNMGGPWRDVTLSSEDDLLQHKGVITYVVSPICAVPAGAEGIEFVYGNGQCATPLMEVRNPGAEGGFKVMCDYDQEQASSFDTKHGEILSRSGDFPIDVPKNIDMALLIKMDKDIVSAKEATPDSISYFARKHTR